MTRAIIWRIVALLAFATGLVGVVLPVLPTVPFMLLAAWAAQKGWPEFERWLLAHPTYGPHIRAWREHGSVPRRAKWLATAMMIVSATAVQFSPAPIYVRVGVPLFLLGVAIWLWRRPERSTT